MTLSETKQLPEVYQNIHQSIYKSHHVLKLVKDMLMRGDSSETILLVIEFLNESTDSQPTNK